MAKVTLVNPNRMKPAVAPIALDYLADWLAAAPHDVHVLDLCFSEDWRKDVDSFFSRNSSDLVGITVRNTDDCYFASRDFFVPFYKEVVDRIRLHSDARIVLGGAGLSVSAKSALRMTGADYAIVGDGEIAMPLLASCIEQGLAPSSIPGLVYHMPEGIQANPPVWKDVLSISPRSRKWLDNRRYFNEGGQAGIETKRGCDGKCIYCADPIGKGTVCRLRPPSLVVREIETLLDQGIDSLHLCDSEFNLPVEHAESVCREIIARGLGNRMRWFAYASPAPFSDELADLMVRAGCSGIDFGADSGDDEVLRSLGRDFRSEDVRKTAEICHRHGITFMYDLLIGGPEETRESVERTIGLMKEIHPHRVGISIGIRIYDGTGIGRLVRKQGVTPSNKNLHGVIDGNVSFLSPIYFLSEKVGLEVEGLVSDLVEGDSRFLHASTEDLDANYNYNDNSVLVQAIRQGYRGAYWDILRRVQEGLPSAHAEISKA